MNNDLSKIQSQMKQAMSLLKKSVDLSLPLLGSKQEKEVKLLWEEFIQEFLDYAKEKKLKIPFHVFLPFR
ncbi:hypothetical protein [Desulfolucanica intricata]|uniref:hypothetical protein n=1 Tax=Desulfolucanica intricata TaxID=1285191 RepID=UPI000835F37A|nr:hypothetical protein [Desulfolucanica intricata]